MAFSPWRLRTLTGYFPEDQADEIAGHRIVSALASCGEAAVVCHSVYCPQDHNVATSEALDSLLYKRITALPHAHHIIGGDWQAELEGCRFGCQLRDLEWVSHGQLCGSPSNEHASTWKLSST